MIKGKTPLISFVVCARNDNYGGRFLDRMQVFINSLTVSCQRHQLQSEIIIVEWNSIQDRPRLKDALNFPKTNYVSTTIIEVPSKIHDRFKNSDKIPVF